MNYKVEARWNNGTYNSDGRPNVKTISIAAAEKAFVTVGTGVTQLVYEDAGIRYSYWIPTDTLVAISIENAVA